MNNIDKVREIVEKNNGILFVKDLEKNNIHRQYLKQLEETGYLRKVSRGIYLKKGKEVNEFFIMGEKYKKGIFSHNTNKVRYDIS